VTIRYPNTIFTRLSAERPCRYKLRAPFSYSTTNATRKSY